MPAPREERASWSIQEAEQLLLSLKGVVSARLVTRPGGEIEEVHLLTTEEVAPKQTVRNVESALLAHLGVSIDHRRISVAQTMDRPPSREPDVLPVAIVPETPRAMDRLVFQSHQVETERSRKVRHRVELEWRGNTYQGEAAGADLPRARLEAVAEATLTAVEDALVNERDLSSEEDEGRSPRSVSLSLDGVKAVDAFDRTFILVGVHALSGREVTPLAGAAVVEESADRAAILATLQATDRWVRGQI